MADQTLPFDFADDEEAEIRLAWRKLYQIRLPGAAEDCPDWPVTLDHCFARILLDNAVGRHWREVIEPPAWKNTPLPVLQTAIDLGEAILSGEADLWTLNDASLIMRNKKPRGRKPARRRRPKWTRTI